MAFAIYEKQGLGYNRDEKGPIFNDSNKYISKNKPNKKCTRST